MQSAATQACSPITTGATSSRCVSSRSCWSESKIRDPTPTLALWQSVTERLALTWQPFRNACDEITMRAPSNATITVCPTSVRSQAPSWTSTSAPGQRTKWRRPGIRSVTAPGPSRSREPGARLKRAQAKLLLASGCTSRPG
jgi:hypothetical protein